MLDLSYPEGVPNKHFIRAPENVETQLTYRWHLMRRHKEQSRLVRSSARFKVVPAGRRSGKTERAKRKLVLAAGSRNDYPDPVYIAAAPTRDQAKRIYWKDLKALVPKWWVRPNGISDGGLTIDLWNGAQIAVVGLDKPERVEGRPLNGIILDEFANMKPEVWENHVRPMLTDRNGWCWLIGVPEGRNHYYDLYKRAQELRAAGDTEWDTFTWVTADIQPAKEIEDAKRDMDELSFQQEYLASFVNFSGRAYYNFDEKLHCRRLEYNPRADLIFMFDFNVSPGVAAVGQEMKVDGLDGEGIIGEVHIPRNSNTEIVTNKLIKDWGHHAGNIRCYGDFTGGSGGSAKTEGSDWDIISKLLCKHYGRDRVRVKLRHNPSVRERLNAMNARLLSMSKEVRFVVDPSKAPNVVKDFEGVRVIEGGSGEIDKKIDPRLTHLTDAIGYRIAMEYPLRERRIIQKKIRGMI